MQALVYLQARFQGLTWIKQNYSITGALADQLYQSILILLIEGFARSTRRTLRKTEIDELPPCTRQAGIEKKTPCAPCETEFELRTLQVPQINLQAKNYNFLFIFVLSNGGNQLLFVPRTQVLQSCTGIRPVSLFNLENVGLQDLIPRFVIARRPVD